MISAVLFRPRPGPGLSVLGKEIVQGPGDKAVHRPVLLDGQDLERLRCKNRPRAAVKVELVSGEATARPRLARGLTDQRSSSAGPITRPVSWRAGTASRRGRVVIPDYLAPEINRGSISARIFRLHALDPRPPGITATSAAALAEGGASRAIQRLERVRDPVTNGCLLCSSRANQRLPNFPSRLGRPHPPRPECTRVGWG
jgi:hypothetical protein